MIKFEKIVDYDAFCRKIRISKDNYSIDLYDGFTDLIDTHGICATDDMVNLISQEIEFGIKNIKELWKMNNYTEKALDESKKRGIQLRRVRLTKEEKREIYKFVDKLRGPHDCVLKGNL